MNHPAIAPLTDLHDPDRACLLRQRASLQQIVESIAHGEGLRPLLTEILELACRVLGGESGVVGIYDAERDLIRLEAVFKPFVTTKAHGMGMGLAVSRTSVSAHGGRLWATNNPVRGATFHLTLPAAAVATA